MRSPEDHPAVGTGQVIGLRAVPSCIARLVDGAASASFDGHVMDLWRYITWRIMACGASVGNNVGRSLQEYRRR